MVLHQASFTFPSQELLRKRMCYEVAGSSRAETDVGRAGGVQLCRHFWLWICSQSLTFYQEFAEKSKIPFFFQCISGDTSDLGTQCLPSCWFRIELESKHSGVFRGNFLKVIPLAMDVLCKGVKKNPLEAEVLST